MYVKHRKDAERALATYNCYISRPSVWQRGYLYGARYSVQPFDQLQQIDWCTLYTRYATCFRCKRIFINFVIEIETCAIGSDAQIKLNSFAS